MYLSIYIYIECLCFMHLCRFQWHLSWLALRFGDFFHGGTTTTSNSTQSCALCMLAGMWLLGCRDSCHPCTGHLPRFIGCHKGSEGNERNGCHNLQNLSRSKANHPCLGCPKNGPWEEHESWWVQTVGYWELRQIQSQPLLGSATWIPRKLRNRTCGCSGARHGYIRVNSWP